MYALARSVALAVIAVVALMVGSMPFLVAVAVAMVIVQAADAVIGNVIGDRVKTIGPPRLRPADLAALIWLLAGA